MKKKINIFTDIKISPFLTELFSDYELFFMSLNEAEKNYSNTKTNVIFVNNAQSINGVDLKKLKGNFLIFSNYKNKDKNTKHKFINTPTPINYIKNTIENFLENLKIKFHDITIVNEKLTNEKNNYFCYLTKLELEILSHLIIEKESTKKYIQEKILNIKSTIETNSLDSHLTRIRKKLTQINTSVKIQSKKEKLLISI